jgi:restriction system protein
MIGIGDKFEELGERTGTMPYRKRRLNLVFYLIRLGGVFVLGIIILKWFGVGPLLLIGGMFWIIRRWYRARHRRSIVRQSRIIDIDRMSGRMFEECLLQLFRSRGWHVYLTPPSGDYGADLVGTDENGQVIVIQAKRYQRTVGVRAVQEVLGGKVHYRASRALVITNNEFTPNARTLARQANVELWDRIRLIEELGRNTELRPSQGLDFW